ncbi:MAG: toll/interleukin-1 receptor domain-containing protein [Promethearchaeota archaeon]|nr:MAG: toll/interleukin-1 receptor domain-containing protein [Candidatus Lokiarchaeota archaeon]
MNIFFSYASDDQIDYKVEQIVDFLEYQEDIERVYYWARDTEGGQKFDDYMRSSINASDLVIVLFTENTRDSIPCIQEIGMAKAFQKKILPVFEDIEDVCANVQISRGVCYTNDFRAFCEDLYFKIAKKKARFKEKSPLMELRNEMHENFEFNKLSYVEPEFRAISQSFNEEGDVKIDHPLISYRIFNFILFDPLNKGTLNIVTAAPKSGKSVLLASLKYDILHREQLSNYIPYLVIAKNIDLSKDILDALYDNILPETDNRYISNLLDNIKSGKGILLIDGLNGSPDPKGLLQKLYDFAHSYNARIIITCVPVICDYIKDLSLEKDRYIVSELNTFKPSSLFEWIVLNKNNFDQTRQYQAEQIYIVLSKIIREKEKKGIKVLLPILMQKLSI